jgi:hypothetical protein
MIPKSASYAILLIALLIFPTFLYAQQDQKKSGMEEVLKRYAGMYADFLSMYSATYAGEHNAELESVQNQFLGKAEDGLQNNGFEADLSDIRTLLSSFTPGGRLETDLNSFQNETGVKIYLTGLIDGYGGDKIAGMFNTLSKQKHPEEKIAPYLEVLVTQQKDSVSNHYALSVEVIPSEGVNIKKAEKYFNEHFDSKYASRREARQRLKGVFMVAFTELKEKLGTQYLPDLAIKHEGVKYRTGDKFEVTQDPEGEITLKAVNKEDQPAQDVEWEVLPREGKLLSAEGNQMTLLIDEEGYWEVTASNGSDEVTVTVDVVKVPLSFDEALKAIVREVLRETREKTEKAIASEQARQDSLQQTASGIEDDLYPDEFSPLQTGEEAFVSAEFLYADNSTEWLPQTETQKLKQDPKIRQYLENQRLKLLNTASLLLQLKIEDFIMSILDEPDNFSTFIEALKEDAASELGTFIGQSITGQQRDALKVVVVNYVNQKVEKISRQTNEE